jgi:hypothetical protein
MPIPQIDTPEWEAEVKFYLASTREQRDERAQELGMNVDSYEKRMRERGIKLSERNSEIPPLDQRPIIVNLPTVKLREYKGKKTRRGDEEEAILHMSDGHAGKITPSYDPDVYKSRIDTLFDATMTIVTLHRHMYPIKKLRIIKTGDEIQGESPYQGSKVGGVAMGARDQVAKLAFPTNVRLIASLKQEFEEIEIECVPGNHGWDRLSPETSREDLRLYDLLKAYFENTKGIKINIYENFGTIVNVMGFKCFLFHGDGIPCQQGVPFFAIDKKLKAWYMQYGGFNYAFGGHFHKRHSDEISSRLEYFMCGTLVSDDDWALKKLGISSSPSQNIYGMHPKMGVTWRYGLNVDRKFLAEKLPQSYPQTDEVKVHG